MPHIPRRLADLVNSMPANSRKARDIKRDPVTKKKEKKLVK